MKISEPKKFKEASKIEFLLLRQKLGFSRYIKTFQRDPEKKKILIDLALKTMKAREQDDYIEIKPGFRKIKIA